MTDMRVSIILLLQLNKKFDVPFSVKLCFSIEWAIKTQVNLIQPVVVTETHATIQTEQQGFEILFPSLKNWKARTFETNEISLDKLTWLHFIPYCILADDPIKVVLFLS